MKLSLSRHFIILAVALALTNLSAAAFDLKGLFGGGSSSSSESDGNDNKLGNIIGGIVGNLIS
ncbi:MAG: hypothetical protein K2O79_02895, partial [Muribaculaceae bacterium]|nr:hypothetical protein [Muribaculaceae bacterium]